MIFLDVYPKAVAERLPRLSDKIVLERGLVRVTTTHCSPRHFRWRHEGGDMTFTEDEVLPTIIAGKTVTPVTECFAPPSGAA